jgi:hypothetical protein
VEALDAILRSHDVVAVLGRDVTIRLVDISNSGCLIQSEVRLAEGTTGTVRVTYGGADYVDDVRIVRCQAPNAGDHWFRLGAEFLWTTHPGERSLRRVVAALQPGAAHAMRLEAGRES